ncbi:MAG TPA: sensor domain-containing diguanylate cyclase, partial [Gaiellaceae bacterium]|nr:sensor domain-containing diguanylate cyclase [Gaiellaceae bacterium]
RGVTDADADADVAAARAIVNQGSQGLVVGIVALTALSLLVGGIVAALVIGDEPVWEVTAATLAAGLAVAVPLVVVFRVGVLQKRGLAMALDSVVQERMMAQAATRREFETRLARSLEMADDEMAAHETIRRALAIVVPARPVELLLADNSHAHLEQTVVSDADDGEGPACPVGSPNRCIAVRRSQTQRFGDSEALDACPMLRGRPQGRCSAVCVPVSIAGRSVGVLHAVAPLDEPLDDDVVADLQTLSDQSGHRLGMLRIMAETQLQATTDGLTGLMNRRSLENRAHALSASNTRHAAVMADLDHFKTLNDTHGHEAGDRALRLFAQTLRAHLRANDLACRYGGEEFLVILPDTEMFEAIEIVERVRDALRTAAEHGGVPSVTASFGIAHSDDADDLDGLVQRADQALFAAKRGGRDLICLDGHDAPVAQNLTAIG